MLRVARTGLLACVVVACGGGAQPEAKRVPVARGALEKSPPRPLPRAPTACDVATADRARAASLARDGELERALRVLAAADKTCPGSSRASLALRMTTLAEADRDDEAIRVADALEASAGAPADAKAIAKRVREEVHSRANAGSNDAAAELLDRAQDNVARANLDEAKRLSLDAWGVGRPNGRALASAGLVALAQHDDRDARRLLDRAMGDLEAETHEAVALSVLEPARGHHGRALSEDFTLAALEEGHDVVILDRRTARETLRLRGDDTFNVRRMAFSPDRRRVAVSGPGVGVAVWDLATAKRLNTVGSRGGSHLVYLGDGNRVAQVVQVGTGYAIDVLDTTSGAVVATATYEDAGDVRQIALSPNDESIVTLDHAYKQQFSTRVIATKNVTDRRQETRFGVRTLHIQSGKKTSHPIAVVRCETLTTPGAANVQQERCETGNAVLRTDGARVKIEIEKIETPPRVPRPPPVVRVFDAYTGAVVADFGTASTPRRVPRSNEPLRDPEDRPERGIARDVAVSRDGTKLLVAMEDHTIRLVSIPDGSSTMLAANVRYSARAAFAPDAHVFASGGEDGSLAMWSAGSLHPTWKVPAPAPPHRVRTLAFSPDGRRLATTRDGETASIYDVSSGRQTASVTMLAMSGGGELAFSPDGLVLAVPHGHDVLFVDPETGATTRTLTSKDGDEVQSLAFSPDGRTLVAGCFEAIEVWDVASGDLRRAIRPKLPSVHRIAISPDGRVVCATSTRAIECFGMATGERTLDLATDDPAALVLAPDGAHMWSVEGGNVVLRRVVGGAELARLLVVRDKDGVVARATSGEVEPMGPAARAAMTCSAGPFLFPFDLCESRFRAEGILRRSLAGEPLDP